MAGPTLPLDRLDAVIFDMDGVATDTASVHTRAWKRLFDDFLSSRAGQAPFDPDADYRRYVDGKPRSDGVRDFLASRGIHLPEGDADDPPDRETVRGLGNRKNGFFRAALAEEGAQPYPSTVALVRELRARGVGTAIISASRNMDEVLEAAGITGIFDARVDGVVAAELGLAGKPDPAVFIEAASRLGVPPDRAAVVEDALAGVEAGRRGGFGLVIGVDRTGHPDDLLRSGADVVVGDLGELQVPAGAYPRIGELPPAGSAPEVGKRLTAGRPAVFLDYDGTLSPIVDDPAAALLPAATRRAVERLAPSCPVAILSGRDLADVRRLVGVEGIVYAGSHGFDIVDAGGTSHQRGTEFLPALDEAAAELQAALGDIPGVLVERKRFAISIHHRRAEEAVVPDIERIVDGIGARHRELRRTGGKKLFELRPTLEWDKGRALLWLLDLLGLDGEDVVPVYVGDDETDEDAFRALRRQGLPIVVRGESDDRRTAARYSLAGPDEVCEFLEEVARLTASAGA